MLENLEEAKVKDILASFCCPLNRDIENFIHTSAIEFEKQSISRTTLVGCSYRDNFMIAGYYTLANKAFCLKKEAFSKTKWKKVSKFAVYDSEFKRHMVSAPLIAQLGKNKQEGIPSLITGDELLKMACDDVAESQMLLGGKLIYLECENKPKLVEFYERNGFFVFGERPLDRDEKDDFDTDCLLQLLKVRRS